MKRFLCLLGLAVAVLHAQDKADPRQRMHSADEVEPLLPGIYRRSGVDTGQTFYFFPDHTYLAEDWWTGGAELSAAGIWKFEGDVLKLVGNTLRDSPWGQGSWQFVLWRWPATLDPALLPLMQRGEDLYLNVPGFRPITADTAESVRQTLVRQWDEQESNRRRFGALRQTPPAGTSGASANTGTIGDTGLAYNVSLTRSAAGVYGLKLSIKNTSPRQYAFNLPWQVDVGFGVAIETGLSVTLTSVAENRRISQFIDEQALAIFPRTEALTLRPGDESAGVRALDQYEPGLAAAVASGDVRLNWKLDLQEFQEWPGPKRKPPAVEGWLMISRTGQP